MLHHFQETHGRLREWHRSMAAMPREAQDLEICNIFGGGCCSRVEVGRKTARSTSTTQTTSISAEAGEASENDTVATSVSPEPSPKRKACGSKMPLHQRAPPNKRSASSPGSSCQTTSSEPTEKISKASSAASAQDMHRKPRRKYKKRARGGKRGPKVELRGIISDVGEFVCRESAKRFFRVGVSRIQRVLEGRPDRRHKGYRLPNNHAVFAPQLSVCRSFLTHVWNFWAEGLPDRFHMATRGNIDKSLAIGDVHVPLPNLDLKDHNDEPDSDEALEVQERAIAAAALHISLKDASAGGLSMEGPSLHRGPCRYLGVLRPVMLYATLSRWCAERNSNCPGFTTFLRSLKEAKPMLKFRKAAGQHASCTICAHFKKLLTTRMPPTHGTRCSRTIASTYS